MFFNSILVYSVSEAFPNALMKIVNLTEGPAACDLIIQLGLLIPKLASIVNSGENLSFLMKRGQNINADQNKIIPIGVQSQNLNKNAAESFQWQAVLTFDRRASLKSNIACFSFTNLEFGQSVTLSKQQLVEQLIKLWSEQQPEI
jgi:hypothetical protein